jgi:hypothetical protein
MRILSTISIDKQALPSGSLNVRFRQMRCAYQVFAGRTYITGASGETAEDAIEQLKKYYEVSEDTDIKIH